MNNETRTQRLNMRFTKSKIHYLLVLDRAHFPVVEDNTKKKKYLN